MTTQDIEHSWQGSLFDDEAEGYSVRPIAPQETYSLLLNIHYAKRIPSIVHSFGLFLNGDLRGVITYGIPPSPTLCRGVCGESWAPMVLELNRLCLIHNSRFEAGRLVGASLRLLPRPTIVVSYADTAQDHVGIVYQATNFLYTGITKPRIEWTVRGLEHLHNKSIWDIADEAGDGSLEAVKQMFGDRFYYRDRSQKHRYVYLVGSRSQRRAMRQDLNYDVLDYPKERGGSE